jgi:hypothetical protein
MWVIKQRKNDNELIKIFRCALNYVMRSSAQQIFFYSKQLNYFKFKLCENFFGRNA